MLRGDNEWIELGERSQIQDNATLHTDPGFPMTIGANCVIGHNVMLHGCTIGDNSLIGMGAILLNGAKIGNNSLVGAGALVTEGKSFPDNSLIVGAPARAIRTLDDKARADDPRAAPTSTCGAGSSTPRASSGSAEFRRPLLLLSTCGVARNAIASRFHLLMATAAAVRSTISFSEKCLRTSS